MKWGDRYCSDSAISFTLMKLHSLWLLITAVLVSVAWQHSLVAEEYDQTAIYFAIQCEKSSGYLAENYLEYGQNLVKTISLLTAEQQARVFGFELTKTETATNKAGHSNNSSGTQENGSQTEIPEEQQLLDKLLQWFGEL